MSLWFLLLFCKIASGLVLGLTAAIIVQTLLKSGAFSLIFVAIGCALAFLRLVWSYKFMGLAVVNLFFIFLFFLFKLYVSMASS